MGIGVSVFLLAIGAILAFAVDLTVSGLDLATVGVILMIVGAIGLVTSMLRGGRPGRPRRPPALLSFTSRKDRAPPPGPGLFRVR
jgi:hypothetical protein